MPPRPRRPSASGRAPTRQPAPDPDELVPQTAEVDVVEPAPNAAIEPTVEAEDGAEGESAGDSSASSRRTASGKRPPSSRSARQSSRSSGRASARRQLSPEQIAARSAARKTVLLIVVGLIVLGGAGYGLWYVALRHDDRQLRAAGTLSDVRTDVAAIETSLINRQAEGAEQAYEHAVTLLSKSPELGYAKDSPNDSDPQFAGMATWSQAKELHDQLVDRLKPRIDKAQRDSLATGNQREILARFARLSDPAFSDADLQQLDKDAGKFLDNPVEPEGSRSDERVAEYQTLVTAVQVLTPKIAAEQARRKEALTSAPAREAFAAASTLIAGERFKEALAKVDDLARQYPDADLSHVRAMVTESAQRSWDAAAKFAETNYITATSVGSDGAQKQAALEAAKRRMHEVIDRFGLDEYIAKANAELAKYGG